MDYGISGFYQWLGTNAPVTFQADGVNWLNQTINTNANRYMPQIQMGPMSMKFQFSDQINGSQLPINGRFDTPILNGAVFHQSTFNDLFGLEGLSLTAGLRLDYESLRLKYDTGCEFTHTYSLSGVLQPLNKEISMIRNSLLKAEQLSGKLSHDYVQLLPKIALQYNFDKGNNIYVSATKGYRSVDTTSRCFQTCCRMTCKAV